MTRSLSNMIKAYSVRYREEKKVVDVSERAEALNVLMAANEAKAAEVKASFVSGLQAISLEDREGFPTEEAGVAEGEELSAAAKEGLFADQTPEAEAVSTEEKARLEALEIEATARIKAELTEAEKMALRIEMEKQIRTQADIILEQARAQGEQVKEKARQEAEAEKPAIFEAARQEGYAAGEEALQQELARLNEEYAAKEQALVHKYEQKARELEPKAAEVVIQLLDSLTGALLESKRGIVTHLVSKALTEAERSDSFLIKVSREDAEEVRAAAKDLRAMFDREVSLEVVADVLLKKGECLIETDSNVMDCSLGTQLEGLKEDIRLLSVRERA